MPQLNPVWFASQLFWLVISFITLYLILSRFVLPPLMEVIARRKETREGDISMAESLRREADAAREHYEKALAEARARVQQLMDETEAAQKQKAERAIKELDAQMETKLAEAQKRIGQQKEKLLNDLTPAVISLTGEIVEKLTKRAPANDAVGRALTAISKRNG